MSSAPKFGLFGIPVRVDPFFVMILLLFGFSMYAPFGGQYVLSFATIAALSVLVHELGHALAFKAYGMKPSITLYGMGGLTSASGEVTPLRNVVISLAGPLPPLLVVGVPALILTGSPGLGSHVILDQVVFVNLVWSVLNLVPVLPLDGGVVAASLLDLAFAGRGRRIASVISLVVLVGLGVWALSVGWIFLLVFVGMLGLMNIRELSTDRSAGSHASSEPLVEAHRALLGGQPHLAEHLAHQGILVAGDLSEQRWGNELLAWARLFGGDIAGAQHQAEAMGSSRQPSQSLFGAIALASGRHDEGVTLLAWSFVHEPAGPAKSLAAVAAGQAGATGELAHELAAMGAPGAEARQLLAQLLDYAGYRDQALAVATGRSEAYGPQRSGPRWPASAAGPAHIPAGPGDVPAGPGDIPAGRQAPSAPGAVGPTGWPSAPPPTPPLRGSSSQPESSPWDRPS